MGALLLVLLLGPLLAGCYQAPALVVYKTPPIPAPSAEKKAALAAPAAPVASAVVPTSVIAQRGDTVYAIARRYNVSVRGVIESNRMRPPYKVLAGERVKLPQERIHRVNRGETVYGIARRYGIAASVLARANGLGAPFQLRVGQDLRVPTAFAALQAETARGVTSRKTRTATAAPTAAPTKKKARKKSASKAVAIANPPRSKGKFLWPLEGRLLSRFGAKAGGLRNDGINIAAKSGATVRASQDGVVAYAGNELRGYGKLLLVRHSGGWTTAYAHNNKLLVRRGDIVRRGQPIARVGATGSVSKPQSHFELRRGSRPVDPLKHLVRF